MPGVRLAVEMRVHVDKAGSDRHALQRNGLRRLRRFRAERIYGRNAPVLYAQAAGQHGHFLRVDQKPVLQ